jgi:hypothetical protein
MDTGVVRDFIISIAGGLFLVITIVTIILGFLLYREIKSLKFTIKGTINTTKAMVSDVKETIKNAQAFSRVFRAEEAKREEPKTPTGSAHQN